MFMKNGKLEEKNANLERELNNIQKKLAYLSNRQKQLQTQGDQEEKLQMDVKELKEKVLKLQNNKKIAEERLILLEGQCDVMILEKERKECQLKKAVTVIQGLKKNLADLKSCIASKEERMEEMKNELVHGKTDSNKDLQQLRLKVDESVHKLRTCLIREKCGGNLMSPKGKDTSFESVSWLQACESNLVDLLTHVDIFRKDAEKQKSELQRRSSQVVDLEERISEVILKLGSTEKAYRELEARRANELNNFHQERLQAEEAKRRLRISESSRTQLEKMLEEANETSINLSKRLAGFSSKAKTACDRCKKGDISAEGLKSKLEENKRAIRKHQLEIAELTDENHILRAAHEKDKALVKRVLALERKTHEVATNAVKKRSSSNNTYSPNSQNSSSRRIGNRKQQIIHKRPLTASSVSSSRSRVSRARSNKR